MEIIGTTDVEFVRLNERGGWVSAYDLNGEKGQYWVIDVRVHGETVVYDIGNGKGLLFVNLRR